MTVWYVVFTKLRQEAVAQENLTRQGYCTYLPRHRVWQHQAGQWRSSLEPLFPRYLLIQSAHGNHSLAPVRSTVGVSRLVCFGVVPAVLQAATVQALRNLEDAQINALPRDDSPFRVGQEVQVLQGPLKGLVGLVASVSRTRVEVLTHLLGRDVTVCVHAEHCIADCVAA